MNTSDKSPTWSGVSVHAFIMAQELNNLWHRHHDDVSMHAFTFFVVNLGTESVYSQKMLHGPQAHSIFSRKDNLNMQTSHSFGKRRLTWRCSRTLFRWWPWRLRVRVRSGQRWELSLFERWHGHQHDVSVFHFLFTYHMVVAILLIYTLFCTL